MSGLVGSSAEFGFHEKLALLEEVMRTSGSFEVDWANIKFPPGRTMAQSQAYIDSLRRSSRTSDASSAGQTASTGRIPIITAPKVGTRATPKPAPKPVAKPVASATTNPDGTPIKRGRGRPRKYPLPADGEVAKSKAGMPLLVMGPDGVLKKRGRGRPTKAEVAERARLGAALKKETATSRQVEKQLEKEAEMESDKESDKDSENSAKGSETRESTPMGDALE